MKKEEAEEVIKILLQCDGGCEYCVSSMLKLFGDKFPEHESLAKSAFKKEFDVKLEDFLDQKNKREVKTGMPENTYTKKETNTQG